MSNISGKMAEGPDPADGMFALEDVDIKEQILIQRLLLDEMKLKDDHRVNTETRHTAYINYTSSPLFVVPGFGFAY